MFLITMGNLHAQVYTISTIAGTGTAGFSNDGSPSITAMVYYSFSISTDSSENIYLADWDNSRVRKINSAGIISTVAGDGKFSFSGDGGPASSSGLAGPTGVFADAVGNIYIADIGNQRIREVTAAGNINTIAGNGTYGFSGDGGPATLASFRNPTGIALDDTGNIYIADVFNNRIRKINKSGIITTIAGDGIAGFSGDGGSATSAELYYPTGLAIDRADNIYIADEDNNRIRKVDRNGIITTIAGNGIGGYSGDGGPATTAELNFPGGVAVDKQNNIYIADASNNRIRLVDPQGIISTIAGIGKAGYSGDGELALGAKLNNPTGLALDASGNVIVGDAFNFRVRKLTKISDRNFNSELETVSIYPNPNHGIFNVMLQNSNGNNETIEIYNVIGEQLYKANLFQNGLTEISLGYLSSGVYLYRVVNDNASVDFRGKIVIL